MKQYFVGYTTNGEAEIHNCTIIVDFNMGSDTRHVKYNKIYDAIRKEHNLSSYATITITLLTEI